MTDKTGPRTIRPLRCRPTMTNPHRFRAKITVFALVMASIVSACSGSSANPTTTTIAGETTTSGPVPSTTPPASAPDASGRGSLGSPLAVGNGFSYTIGGASWRGQLHGLVATDPLDVTGMTVPEGQCAAVVGEVTLDELPDGYLTPDFGQLPFVGLLADVNVLARPSHCAGLEGDGYLPFGSAVAPGTTFSFYVPVLISEGVSAIVIDPTTEPAYFYEPTVITDLPAATYVAGDYLAGLEVMEMGTGETVSATYMGQTWEVAVTGLVEIEPDPGEPGRCFALIGTMVPPNDGEEFAYWEFESFGVMYDGRRHADLGSSCDTSALQDAGYTRTSFEVPTGAPHAFFEAYLIRDARDGRDPEAVHLAGEHGETVALFTPTILASIPTP